MRVNEVIYSVYIVTNIHKSVLYTGMTNSLEERIVEHYLDRIEKKHFTGKYNCFYLVLYEDFKFVNDAIAREKEIKGWLRSKKDRLISDFNPGWDFLNEQVFGEWPPANPYNRKDL
jgi:putative endonuclease